MKLKEKISVLRKQRGLSQQEMAEELYVSRQTISKWESGVASPSRDNLLGIGKLFDVPVSVLMDDEVPLDAPSAPRETREPERKAPVFPWVKRIGIAVCIFLVGVSLGICLGRQDGQENEIVPMEDLVREEVDFSQVDYFSMETLAL